MFGVMLVGSLNHNLIFCVIWPYSHNCVVYRWQIA